MRHALICGAGAVGLCSALFLRERGYDVTVLERDSAGGDSCSFGNGMDITGAVFYPLDCHLDPRLLMRKLTEMALAAGVTFRWSTQVEGWRTQGTQVTAAVT